MPSVLITGANRGLGLAFVRSFAIDGWQVHACCRHPDRARALKEVEGDIVRHRLNVTDEFRIASLAREFGKDPIDILINNAGVYGPRQNFGETDYESWVEVFRVNTMAPLRMTECFVKPISRSEYKMIINISSRMGSISENSRGRHHLYRSSKAALNMLTKGLAADLAQQGITVLSFHPGWAQTEIGGPQATETAEACVAAMRSVIKRVTHADSGKFFNYDGEELPW